MLKRIKKILHIGKQETEPSVYDKIDTLYDELNDDIIVIKIGEDLVPHGDYIVKQIGSLREEIKDECGFIMPPVNVNGNLSPLQENEFCILIRGTVVQNGFLVPNVKGIREEFYETLKTTVYQHIDKIFTNEMTEKYLEIVRRNNSWLIWNITGVLSMTDIKTIMLDIIQKGKSINNVDYIFEQIGEHVLTEGKYRDCLTKFNPHAIAKKIAQNIK